MYMKRKIDDWLVNWKRKKGKSPALVVGIHQCGKTESIENFGKNHYKKIVRVNFWDSPEYAHDFDGELTVERIISNLSLRFPETIITPGDTLIFFDEIQECPRARLSFKNFEKDGRFDVIGSGSYLGINGYITGDSTPAPTGYDEVFNMRTMDFEEFLWAVGYSEEQINEIEIHFNSKTAVPDAIHNTFKKAFLEYACIGGFPRAVKAFRSSKNIMDAVRTVQNTVFDMKSDFGRRKDKNGSPLFKPSEMARIQSAFDLIPTFLSKENKRYITSKIQGGSSRGKTDAIEYLRQAHIVRKVFNLDAPSLPLSGNIIPSQFKLFPEDISIVCALYGAQTIAAMNMGNLGLGKGAIYEALAFDSISKAGFDVFYFAKETGLKIDFVICYNSFSYLVEAKAKTGNTKSSKTVMAHPDHYGKTKLLKIGDYNVGEKDDTITIPHYMTFLLGRKQY